MYRIRKPIEQSVLSALQITSQVSMAASDSRQNEQSGVINGQDKESSLWLELCCSDKCTLINATRYIDLEAQGHHSIMAYIVTNYTAQY